MVCWSLIADILIFNFGVVAFLMEPQLTILAGKHGASIKLVPAAITALPLITIPFFVAHLANSIILASAARTYDAAIFEVVVIHTGAMKGPTTLTRANKRFARVVIPPASQAATAQSLLALLKAEVLVLHILDISRRINVGNI